MATNPTKTLLKGGTILTMIRPSLFVGDILFSDSGIMQIAEAINQLAMNKYRYFRWLRSSGICPTHVHFCQTQFRGVLSRQPYSLVTKLYLAYGSGSYPDSLRFSAQLPLLSFYWGQYGTLDMGMVAHTILLRKPSHLVFV